MLNTRGRGILEGHVGQKGHLCFPLLASLPLPAWPCWSPETCLQTIPWQRHAALWGSTAPRALLSSGPGTLRISPHTPSHWECSILTTPVVQWFCLGTTVLPTRFLQCKGLACLQLPEWWHTMQPSTEGIESVHLVLKVQILGLVIYYMW